MVSGDGLVSLTAAAASLRGSMGTDDGVDITLGPNAFDPAAYARARKDGRLVDIASFTVDEAVENGTFRWRPP